MQKVALSWLTEETRKVAKEILDNIAQGRKCHFSIKGVPNNDSWMHVFAANLLCSTNGVYAALERR